MTIAEALRIDEQREMCAEFVVEIGVVVVMKTLIPPPAGLAIIARRR